MADLLPSEPDVDRAEEPRIIGIDSEEADDLLSALTSDTARKILARLHDDPTTPAKLADSVDTSLQNVQYHLQRLESAGVIEVAGTAYSEKGREMNVYAPADRALVVVAGQQDETAGLKTALSRLLGGVGVLGIASVVLDRVLRQSTAGYALHSGDEAGGADPAAGTAPSGGGAGGAGAAGNATGATATPRPTGTPTPGSTPSATAADGGAAGAAQATATVEPTATAAPSTLTEGAARSTEVATEAATQTPGATSTPAPAATPTPAATPPPTDVATTAAPEAARTVVDSVGPDPIVQTLAGSPGALFFLGGVTVLLAWFAFWLYRRRRE
jgi:DNA-binding transcriptional ArsR family regulator